MAMDVPYRLFNHLLTKWLPDFCTVTIPNFNQNTTSIKDGKEETKSAKTKKLQDIGNKPPGVPISAFSSPQKDVSQAILDFLRDYGVRVEASELKGEEVNEVEIEEEAEEEETKTAVDVTQEEKEKGSTKCLLMNDRGYLIAHPGYAEPVKSNRALESSHISHR